MLNGNLNSNYLRCILSSKGFERMQANVFIAESSNWIIVYVLFFIAKIRFVITFIKICTLFIDVDLLIMIEG